MKRSLSLATIPVQERGLIYSPEKRNMELRDKIESYLTIHDSQHQPTALLKEPIRVRSVSGAVFTLVMLGLLALTIAFFGV